MATAAAPLLDPELFEASTAHDALGRVLTAISPDASEVAYTYDEGGHLQAVDLNHRGSSTAAAVVGDITHVQHPIGAQSCSHQPCRPRLPGLRRRWRSDRCGL